MTRRPDGDVARLPLPVHELLRRPRSSWPNTTEAHQIFGVGLGIVVGHKDGRIVYLVDGGVVAHHAVKAPTTLLQRRSREPTRQQCLSSGFVVDFK